VNRLRLGLATCGFLGLVPVAPGTFGTLGGVLIAWALAETTWFGLWVLLAAAGVYALGRSLGDWAERHAGRKDPGWFVLDEVVGYLITVAWVGGPSPLALLTAFCAFRFFDITKPPPVRRFERIGGGDGIMLDDVVAGLYGWLIVMLPLRLFVDAPWGVGGAA
jgi:phosphatidylglycerophosphatase A